MGIKTKIDWCDSTWSPVTGCLHGCEYCYARKIAKRFSYDGQTLDAPAELQRVWLKDNKPGMPYVGNHYLRYPVTLEESGKVCPYPFAFEPTFHRYKLDEPQKWKQPKNIFVCSMADLFGDWVPDEWITDVFNACKAAPQHRYLFLTKNSKRYFKLSQAGLLPAEDNFWYGTSVTSSKGGPFIYSSFNRNTFISFEPLLEDVMMDWGGEMTDWIIIGAETGNRKGKIIPKKEWITNIVGERIGIPTLRVPIFMKESLRGIMGEDFLQEFPWEV